MLNASVVNEFKNDVRTWIEVDNVIKKLQEMTKERRAFKKRLTERIVRFMNAHDIEHLDTRDGQTLHSKVSYAKTPLTQKAIREGINAYFSEDIVTGARVMQAVFDGNTRGTVERMSLRRSRHR